MTSRSARWADLSRHDFAALDLANAIAVLPVGATEQHGPHLPVSVDTDLVETVVDRALPLIDPGLTVLFLPAIAYGKSNEHAAVPGTLTLSAETLMRVLADIGMSVARAGIRNLVFLNGHGGNTPVLEIAARDLRVDAGLRTVTCHWYNFNEANAESDAIEQAFGIHAGLVETSAMLAIRPERVAMDRAADFDNAARGWQERYRHIGLAPGRARPAWVIDDLNEDGACGNAATATRETGERLLDVAGRNFASFLLELDRFLRDEAGKSATQTKRGS
ncbi:creatininase family protein [Aquamicrobium sp. LC103]|uniref:creatininase family protein n=1 Tax=Aquamicrobium sp. LC103 TaxID=1120658 RepID=UPI00063EC3DD|nr:creatininase family protein [Aquamicrobium sp. LC103]TKT74633.1 creatininase family protein [Aquamicrobium sp. LC103]